MANTTLTDVRRNQFDRPPEGLGPVELTRWDEFRAAYHRAQRLDGVTAFPLQIDFELNSTCQMRCEFCLHGQTKVEKRELGFERFKRVIDEGAQHGLTSIKLNYINEPLLVKDLERYVRYAKGKGVLNVYFATNGLLLTPERSRSLIEAGVTKILVSLDATTAETFQAMRHSPHFERIRDNVLRLLTIRNDMNREFPLVRVNFVKTFVNAHEAESFLRAWEGVADMIGYQDQVAVPGVEQGMLQRHLADFRCSFPYKMVVIDSSGLILPCCTFSGRSMPLGHIDEMTVSEAWHSHRMKQLRTTHRAGMWRDDPVCAECMGC